MGDDRMRRWTGGTVVVSWPVGGRHVDKEIRAGEAGNFSWLRWSSHPALF